MLLLYASDSTKSFFWAPIGEKAVLSTVKWVIPKNMSTFSGFGFIRLRQNTQQLAAGMNGETNHGEARQSEDGLATP